ncbi:hypothetical protein AB1Y20_016929 [Prymnesium parvum]|uniref:F-box domain-containing protein n=1 Tax=Prymnesium parvum TaxID=97485 RepID=A0AB34ICD3_PRYPA
MAATTLPTDLLLPLFDPLGPRARRAASLVCRAWRDAILESERLRLRRLLHLLAPSPRLAAGEAHLLPVLAVLAVPPAAPPRLERLLASELASDRTFAAWAFGAIGGSSRRGCDAMLEASLGHLLACAETALVAAALGRLCRTAPHPLTLAPALPFLARLLHADDADDAAEALGCFARLCAKPRWIPLIFSEAAQLEWVSRVAELLDHPRGWVRMRAVELAGVLVAGVAAGGAPQHDSLRAVIESVLRSRLSTVAGEETWGLLSEATQAVARVAIEGGGKTPPAGRAALGLGIREQHSTITFWTSTYGFTITEDNRHLSTINDDLIPITPSMATYDSFASARVPECSHADASPSPSPQPQLVMIDGGPNVNLFSNAHVPLVGTPLSSPPLHITGWHASSAVPVTTFCKIGLQLRSSYIDRAPPDFQRQRIRAPPLGTTAPC